MAVQIGSPAPRGVRTVVVPEAASLMMWVRFPHAAPFRSRLGIEDAWLRTRQSSVRVRPGAPLLHGEPVGKASVCKTLSARFDSAVVVHGRRARVAVHLPCKQARSGSSPETSTIFSRSSSGRRRLTADTPQDRERAAEIRRGRPAADDYARRSVTPVRPRPSRPLRPGLRTQSVGLRSRLPAVRIRLRSPRTCVAGRTDECLELLTRCSQVRLLRDAPLC